MSNSKFKIIIDLDRLKYPNTGMFNFCINLYQNLSKNNLFNFYFYTHNTEHLNNNFKNILIKFWHIFLLNPNKKYALWHTTNQLSRRVPLKPIKLVYTIHDLNFLYTNKPEWKKRRELKKIQINIDRADYLTFISNFSKKDAEKHLNLENKQQKVIYNGVNVDIFSNFDNPRIIPNGKFIFSLGVIAEKKNFHVIIPLLIDNQYDLVISGNFSDAKYKNLILREAEKYDVIDRVFLTNAITDQEKYWYLDNCEAFVFPSLSEGFGIPPIEAMRFGKPIFLSKLTSLPEIGGPVAYYFDDFEPKNMQEIFKNGMQDYIKNNRKNDIIKWSNQFTWQNAIEGYIMVYREVLELD